MGVVFFLWHVSSLRISLTHETRLVGVVGVVGVVVPRRSHGSLKNHAHPGYLATEQSRSNDIDHFARRDGKRTLQGIENFGVRCEAK